MLRNCSSILSMFQPTLGVHFLILHALGCFLKKHLSNWAEVRIEIQNYVTSEIDDIQMENSDLGIKLPVVTEAKR